MTTEEINELTVRINEENSENKKLKKAVSFIAELLMHTFEEGEITDSQRDALLDIAKTFE